MKVVFLHGIGDGDPKYEWLDGLNRGLTQAGYEAIKREQVIAPRYSSYLKTAGRSGKLPPLTYKQPKDEATARRDFERRQARVQRRLRLDGVQTFGFNLIPDALWEAVPEFVFGHLPIMDLDQVRSYVRDDKVRADVMNHILDLIPTYGDVLLIAHSLGSVIAIDLLDHLHADVHVRRFVTIGSPASIRALHEGSERLLKKFPYARVDDWSNFLNVGDIVTGGRGLASTFPGAQDFLLSGISGHGAAKYLGDPAVAGLVADALYPTKEVASTSADIVVRLSEAEASTLLLQHFAEAVARHIKDAERAERYRATLKILRDDLSAQLTRQAASGHLLAPEMLELANGNLPHLPNRWELHEALGEIVVLALTNCISPYEIDPGDAQRRALEDISVELGFRRDIGKTVAKAIDDVQECVTHNQSSVPWGRVLTAAAGVALIAAGPVGLAVAAPAGAFGAAAITGSLAAFGPGGMVGGLAMLGGLAGTGAAAAAAAVAGGSGSEAAGPNLEKLMMRVATEHARKLLDLPYDSTLWYQLADFECRISATVNRLKAFNDSKSSMLVQLTGAQLAVNALLRFMIEKGLSPVAITDGEPKTVEA